MRRIFARPPTWSCLVGTTLCSQQRGVSKGNKRKNELSLNLDKLLSSSHPSDNTTWGIPPGGITDYATAHELAEELYNDFTQRGLIPATEEAINKVMLVIEIMNPETKKFSKKLTSRARLPGDNTTWGIPPGGITDYATAHELAEELYNDFTQRGLIPATEYNKAILVSELMRPETKEFSKTQAQRKTRVDLTELLLRFNNRATSHTMPLVERDCHINKLNELLNRQYADKTQLIPVVSGMGTGKTQLLKRFLGEFYCDACEDGAVIVVECSLGNCDSAALQSSMGSEHNLMEAVQGIVQRHLEKYFAAELPTAKGDTATEKWGNLVAPHLPLLVLDSANELFTTRLDCYSANTVANTKERSAIEAIVQNLPGQTRVIAAATLPPVFVQTSVSQGSDYVVEKDFPPLEVLDRDHYIKACTDSWGIKLTEYDKKHSAPLFYYLAAGFPRHLRASLTEVSAPAVQVLGKAWPAAVEGMFSSAKLFIPQNCDAIKNGELWTVALVAATKYPVQYSDTIVGHNKTYAEVANFCVAPDGASLRMPPVFVKGLFEMKVMGPQPPGWPNGLELSELYKPFTEDELRPTNGPQQTKRGTPYETIVAHSLVARWWLLHRSGAGTVTLAELLCRAGDGFLSQYRVDLGGGLERGAVRDQKPQNKLWWSLGANRSGSTASHDMLLPVWDQQGVPQWMPIQVRHGSAKTLEELTEQVKDVLKKKYPALLVVHDRQYQIPTLQSTSCMVSKKAMRGKKGLPFTVSVTNKKADSRLVYVDGSAFSRDDIVYALAPLTRK